MLVDVTLEEFTLLPQLVPFFPQKEKKPLFLANHSIEFIGCGKMEAVVTLTGRVTH